MFGTHEYGEAMTEDEVRAAKEVCFSCPVRGSCLKFALDTEVTDGVWAALTWAERGRLCPICGWPKKAVDDLGCTPAHSLLRLARLLQQEDDGDPDVRVLNRQDPSARTNPYCTLPRGHNHSTDWAYRTGCRCTPARLALLAVRRERRELKKESA